MRTWNIHNAGQTLLYRDRSLAFKQSFYYKWKTNNKSCKIMWRLDTSTRIRYILVICVMQLPYSTLYMHRDFTGARGNLNAMKHSIEGAENIYEQSSALSFILFYVISGQFLRRRFYRSSNDLDTKDKPTLKDGYSLCKLGGVGVKVHGHCRSGFLS